MPTISELIIQISDDILNKHFLIISDQLPNKYAIIEIEFYFYNDHHKDVFTHKSEEQCTYGVNKNTINSQNRNANDSYFLKEWYFHKMGNSYKGGTFKGLDISFCLANKKFKQYGGILIRSIEDVEGDNGYNIIEGPCNVVNHILKKNKKDSISEFVNSDLMGSTDVYWKSNKGLRLVKITHPENKEIYSGPRVGLTLNKEDNFDLRKKYIMKNYRFMTRPKYISKYKNTIVLNMIAKGLDDKKILEKSSISKAKLNALKLKFTNKENFKKEKNLSYFKGKKLKADDLEDMYLITI